MAAEKPHGKAAIVQAVIDAAIPLIAEKGVLAISIRDVARAANVNAALIIRHFGSKEAMLNHIGDYLGAKTIEESQKGRQRLDVMWESIISERSVEMRAMARILLDTSPDRDLKAAAGVLDEARTWFHRELNIPEDRSNESSLAVYISACLVIGSEVVGTHVLRALGVEESRVTEVKLKAFRVVLEALSRQVKEAQPK